MSRSEPTAIVRLGGPNDAAAIGVLLNRFNTEFDEPTPTAEKLAKRMTELMASGDTAVLLAGSEPSGIAVLRFRKAIWSAGMECYVAELYVVAEARGEGLGRALMEAGLDLARERGCGWIDLATSEDDVAARGLYESLGFRNRESSSSGPVMFVYEREL